LLFDYFDTNRNALCAYFQKRLGEEREALGSVSISRLRRHLRTYANSYLERKVQKEVTRLAHDKKQTPYRLFTLIYADSYFGLYQCIEIDSIIFSLDQAVRSKGLTEDQRLSLLLCLGSAIKKIATTTGHFAQFLEPNKQNALRFRSQRGQPCLC
jgi:adenine-specific DNA-methyltransferase